MSNESTLGNPLYRITNGYFPPFVIFIRKLEE